MLDKTSFAAHASHDELLIVRLYGGDVDSDERARALDLIADCPDCAGLFADLGAIATAIAASPVPKRPRDFSLTEADAARLARRPRVPFFSLGLRRSLGGALAALGLVGVVVTNMAWVGGGTTGVDRFSPQFAAAGGPTAAPASSAGAADNGNVAAPSPAATVKPQNLTAATPAASAAGLVPAPATPGQSAAAIPTGGNQSKVSTGGTGTESGSGGLTADVARGGVDVRTLVLAGFGVLFVLGLAIAVLPRRRRRGRGEAD